MIVKAIILGAGKGTRMNSDMPKVLHPICGVPMIKILLDTVKQAGISDTTVVIGPDMDAVSQTVTPAKTVIQTERLGTANALLSAKSELAPFDGCVLVMFGDTPLIQQETLTKMVQCYQQGADVVVLGFIPTDVRRYGRLIMGEKGLEKIVEYKDANDSERAIQLCNSGVMCLNGQHVLRLLKKIKNDNAAGEYYLTDIVQIARRENLSCDVVIGDVDELHGINTLDELATAQEIYLCRKEKEVSK